MIIVRLSGGMGNQMFQYAAGRALADKRGVPLALDTTFLLHRIRMPFFRPHFVFRNFDLVVWNIEATIAKPTSIAWWNRPMGFGKLMLIIDAAFRTFSLFRGWEKTFRYNPQFLLFGPDTYLVGFWQSEKYFKDARDHIRSEFTLKEPLAGVSALLLDEITKAASLCIHVRRSDIAANSFHGAISQDYYERALGYVVERSTIEKIYVFSDDIAWCKDNLHFSFPTTFVGNEHAGVAGEGHLALMSACKNFIIPNSTFSWWAAWLSNSPDKIVIAPKEWFKDSLNDASDLIPYSWVRL